MKKLSFVLLCVCLGFLTAGNITAQIAIPAASPKAKIEQKVGLTTVNIEYSRPGVKGRTIFAEDGLVPYGKIWRTGANYATKFSFSDDVNIGGKELKAGSYALLSKPDATSWELMFYPYEGTSWSSYVEATPAATIITTPVTMPMSVETFVIALGDLNNGGANIHLIWDNVYVEVPLTVETDKMVMATIDKVLNGPSATDYYAAGSYLHTEGKDLETALKYVQKATHVDEPKFWQVRKEALILADLKKYKKAIKAAEKSMELAKKANYEEYVRNNQKSIEEWTKMK